MKKTFVTIILTLLSLAFASAQNIKVSGVVLDSKNQPVIGAVVMLDGNSTVATVTDMDGKYTISVPAKNSKLNISCISYKTQVLDVASRARIDVILEDDAQLLDEVVVVGYGSMRRSDLTGSVASVKIDEDDASRSTSLDQLIQGKVSGVQVVGNSAAPDAGVSVRIRGLSTFNGTSDPLYVVDGVIINGASTAAESFSNADSGTAEETNGLNGINPQDIASIEILKDASATAIYGSQGANGVVLITTKGAQKDQPVISFNAGVSVSQVSKRMDVLNFDEYVDYIKEMGCATAYSHIYDNSGNLLVTPVDWQDYSLRPAVGQKYYFSVTGRPKAVQYFFSLGYNNTQGVVKGTGFEQYTMRFTLDKKLAKNLKIGVKTNVAWSQSDMSQGASSGRITSNASRMRSMVSYRPFMGYDPDDESVLEDQADSSSPERWLKYFTNTKRQFRVTPNLYLEWNILPWLTFKTSAGGDYIGVNAYRYKSERISRTVGTTASKNTYDTVTYNWDNLFLVNKKFEGGHFLSGTVGMTLTGRTTDTYFTEGSYLGLDPEDITVIDKAVAPNSSFRYSENAYQIMSFLARGVYNYKERYVLTATFRADGSSRFQDKNKWGFFPSFAFAWRLSEEPWFNASAISSSKIRLGWGQVGNQAVSSYATIPTFSSTTYPDHTPENQSLTQVGVYLNGIANPELKWETTEQWNAGIDFGFFQGRLAFSLDAYSKLTRDLLQNKQIARSSGFSTMWVNQGSIQNRGIEFSVDAVPVKTKNFEWSIGGNISVNRNRITEIGADIQSSEIYLTPTDKQNVNYFWGSTLRSSSSNIAILNIFIENQPMGLFYGLKSDGIVQEGEDWPGFGAGNKAVPGDVKYLDLNGNGCIDDDDRTIIGNPNPDFTYGFNTSFRWKGFTLSADFNGSFGNDVYNNNLSQDLRTNVSSTASTVKNILAPAYKEAWSVTSREAAYPRLGYAEDQNYITDRYVEDASFLRIANLSLSYRIPKRKNAKILKGFSVGASCGNLFVFTKYSGWDPEVNSFGSDTKRMGVDVGSYPQSRSYVLDLKFTF